MVKKVKAEKSEKELLKEAFVPEDEHPYEIPGNWKWVKLGHICKIISGKGFSKSEYSVEGAKLLRITNVSYGEVDWSETSYLPINYLDKVKDLVLSENDLVMALNRPITNNRLKVSLMSKVDLPAILYQRVGLIRPLLKGININFLYIIMLSNFFKNEVQNRLVGTDQPYINLPELCDINIPFPPLFEQKRIVDKLESMLGMINEARELIEEAKETFKNRKAGILAKAFSGELTENWRKEHTDLEVATITINKIKIKREKLAISISQKKNVKEIYSYNDEKVTNFLPITWAFITLDKLCENFQYGTSSKSESEGKVVVLRMGNLQQGKIDWTDLAYTSDNNEIEKYKLNLGDVLFNRTNSPELVGKTSIYLGDQPAIFAGYLIKINNYPELDSKYLNYFLNSNAAKNYCWKVKTDGVSQSNINAQKLGKFEIPFAPIEEQKEIVRIVEHLLSLEDQAKEVIDNMEEELNLLEKSILSKAFRGELGTNNPTEQIEFNKEKIENEMKQLELAL
jgi:type I restriction enzyme S subunit